MTQLQVPKAQGGTMSEYPADDESNLIEKGLIYTYALGQVVCNKTVGMLGSPKKIQEPNPDSGNYGEDYEIRGWEDGPIKVVIGIVATITGVKDAVKKLGFGGKSSKIIDPNNKHCVIDDIFD